VGSLTQQESAAKKCSKNPLTLAAPNINSSATTGTKNIKVQAKVDSTAH
jgi:hypothetical protein